MNSLSEIQKELLQRAAQVRKNAYCPYSQFAVGAAILCAGEGTGSIFAGCNVENASSGLGVCAERHAVAAAVAAGARPGCLSVVAVVGGDEGGPAITPCGACRQVLAEFSASAEAGGMLVLCAPRWSGWPAGSREEQEELALVRSYRLAELIPHWFSRA